MVMTSGAVVVIIYFASKVDDVDTVDVPTHIDSLRPVFLYKAMTGLCFFVHHDKAPSCCLDVGHTLRSLCKTLLEAGPAVISVLLRRWTFGKQESRDVLGFGLPAEPRKLISTKRHHC